MNEYTNKDVMPEFIPPEPSEARGWHCWHEYNQHLNTPAVRQFVCCHCGGYAAFSWVNEFISVPVGHGQYYPTCPTGRGEWKFQIASVTRYVCEEGKNASGVK